MEKRKSGVNWWYIVIALLVVTVIVLAIIPSMGSAVAEDCLRGNQYACVYFQAQENVYRAQEELRLAREALATARAEYKNSVSTEE
jgi:hypothetical protein